MTEAKKIEMLERNLREIATDIALGRAGTIHAIKAWRAATGATLKDAKDYVVGLSQRAEKSQEDSRIQRVEYRLGYLEQRVSRLESSRAITSQDGQ